MSCAAFVASAVCALFGSVESGADGGFAVLATQPGTVENRTVVLIDVMSDLREPVGKRADAFDALCALDPLEVLPILFDSLGEGIELEATPEELRRATRGFIDDGWLPDEIKREARALIREGTAAGSESHGWSCPEEWRYYGSLARHDTDGDGLIEVRAPEDVHKNASLGGRNSDLHRGAPGVVFLKIELWNRLVQRIEDHEVSVRLAQDLYSPDIGFEQQRRLRLLLGREAYAGICAGAAE